MKTSQDKLKEAAELVTAAECMGSKKRKRQRGSKDEAEPVSEMSQAAREDLSNKDFVIPAERLFPIQDAKQAMTALTYATWPKNKKHKAAVFEAVKKRYPEVWNRFEGKGKSESIATIGDAPGVRERLNAVRELLADAEALGRSKKMSSPDGQESIAAMFSKPEQE